jgi:ADP-ribose pyrophosphatase
VIWPPTRGRALRIPAVGAFRWPLHRTFDDTARSLHHIGIGAIVAAKHAHLCLPDSRGLAGLTRLLPLCEVLPSPRNVRLRTRARAPLGDNGKYLRASRVDGDVAYQGAADAAALPFQYELIERVAGDAVVVVAHARVAGVLHVLLRENIRLPLHLRTDLAHTSALWEVCAGLVESGEAPAHAGLRELFEEFGAIPLGELRQLGACVYPAPAVLAERHYFYECEVDLTALQEPTGDSSAFEADARLVGVPLAAALHACETGAAPDSKTELALRRLAARYP